MKRYIPLILALCLLLSACAGVQMPDNTTTLPNETTLPEETTTPEETTLPEEDTASEQSKLNFSSLNIEHFVFTKDRLGSRLDDLIVADQLKDCQEGALYRYHIDSWDLIQIVEGPVVEYIYITDLGYFYTLESDKRTVMFTDLMGEQHVPFYTAQHGDVNYIVFNWDDDLGEGYLYTLEGDTHIVETSYPVQASKIFFTDEGIKNFSVFGYPEPYRFSFRKKDDYGDYKVDLETGEVTRVEHL